MAMSRLLNSSVVPFARNQPDGLQLNLVVLSSMALTILGWLCGVNLADVNYYCRIRFYSAPDRREIRAFYYLNL